MSSQDVENYKQIKEGLDKLRLTVEKSELWVEKSGSYGNEEQSKEQMLEVRPLQSVHGRCTKGHCAIPLCPHVYILYFNSSGLIKIDS